MRIFSYRNKRALKRAVWIAVGVLLLLTALVIGRFVYLERYVTYTPDGVVLDYEQKIRRTDIDPQQPDPEKFPFETLLAEAEEEESAEQPPQQLKGYYVTTTMMAKQLDRVRDALDQLEPEVNAVMLDAKSIFGFYYYKSDIEGAETAEADINAIAQMTRELAKEEGLTLIARVPAFCDPEYALRHQEQALPLYTGALWTDDNRCYWLNPFKNDVQGYLVSIAIELSKLGFDEVLFDGFYVPDSDRIAWSKDVSREDAAIDAALNISDSLYGYGIRVSFGSQSPAIGKYADRLYITTDDPTRVMELKDTTQEVLPDPQAQLVFLTDSRDTRFEECSVLAPLLDIE